MYTDEEIRAIGMERFISDFIRNSGDYTLARREMFDDMTVDEVLDSADRYMEDHPLSPDTLSRLEAYKRADGEERSPS